MDNCPYQPNPDQSDLGGIGIGSLPDGTGDAFQCGDVNGDGFVTLADATLYLCVLLVPADATFDKPELCNVALGPVCNIVDAVVVRRALLVPPTATIQPVCEANLPH